MNLASKHHIYFEACMILEVSKLYFQIYIYIMLAHSFSFIKATISKRSKQTNCVETIVLKNFTVWELQICSIYHL